MAMQLDLTTVVKTKVAALRAAGSGGSAKDATTAFGKYVQSVIATAASSARKDANTRVWLDLPHT